MDKARVTMYTLSTCIHCKAAKNFLQTHSVDYDFTDVDLLTGEARQEAIEAVKVHNPRCSFPTILIGDEVIVGFQEDLLRKALGIA